MFETSKAIENAAGNLCNTINNVQSEIQSQHLMIAHNRIVNAEYCIKLYTRRRSHVPMIKSYSTTRGRPGQQ